MSKKDSNREATALSLEARIGQGEPGGSPGHDQTDPEGGNPQSNDLPVPSHLTTDPLQVSISVRRIL